MSESCENCRFRVEKQCRRRAPGAQDFLQLYGLELVRDAVWSLRALAKIADPNEYDDASTEATEAATSAFWPDVHPTDWCGEWERRVG